MSKASAQDYQEFLGVIDRIPDSRIRYFYMMLGDAIGEFSTQARKPLKVNTGAGHIADLKRRLNATD